VLTVNEERARQLSHLIEPAAREISITDSHGLRLRDKDAKTLLSGETERKSESTVD